MPWLDAPNADRRPVVFVEDHLYHTTEMLSAMAAHRPDLLGEITVCALDREGPDTAATLAEWRRQYPQVRVWRRPPETPFEEIDLGGRFPSSPDGNRPPRSISSAAVFAFAREVAGLLRPGGILVQDIQLSTLPFLPADRWWESIYLAATVRGLFADRAPTVRFLSNKRGYAATFGRELADAGFDPRDVMDKAELTSAVVPAIATLIDRAFPLRLQAHTPDDIRHLARIADHPLEQVEIDRAFDLVWWDRPGQLELAGRLVAGTKDDGRLALKADSHEARTWQALIEDRLHEGPGLAVVDVGARVGPLNAERAELTNLAARHIHTLRSRLSDPSAIVTAGHAYRLGDRVRAGLVTRAV